VTVPPDRSGELKVLQNEIDKIKSEMQRLKKADEPEVKVKLRTVPPKNHHRLKMSTNKNNRPEKSLGDQEGCKTYRREWSHLESKRISRPF
jgi:hypothetical protein